LLLFLNAISQSLARLPGLSYGRTGKKNRFACKLYRLYRHTPGFV
jgi:hypothetical protein